jgi:hypothetical protein
VHSRNLVAQYYQPAHHHHHHNRSGPSSVVSSSVNSSTMLSEVASVLLDARPRRARMPHTHRKKRVRSPLRNADDHHDDLNIHRHRHHDRDRGHNVRMAAEYATSELAFQRYAAMYGDEGHHNANKEHVPRDDRSDVTPSVMSKMDVDDISVHDAVDAKDVGVLPPDAVAKLTDNALTESPGGFGWNRMLEIADWDKEMKKLVGLAIPFCLQGVSVEFFAIVNVAIVGHFIGVKEANAFVVVSILLEFTATLTKGFAECK